MKIDRNFFVTTRMISKFADLLVIGQRLTRKDELKDDDSDNEYNTYINDHLDLKLYHELNKFVFTFYSRDHLDVHSSIAGFAPAKLTLTLTNFCRRQGCFFIFFNPLSMTNFGCRLPDFIPKISKIGDKPNDLLVTSSSIPVPVDSDGIPLNDERVGIIYNYTNLTYGYHLAHVQVDNNGKVIIDTRDKYKFGFHEMLYVDPELFNNNEVIAFFIEDQIACRRTLDTNLLQHLTHQQHHLPTNTS